MTDWISYRVLEVVGLFGGILIVVEASFYQPLIAGSSYLLPKSVEEYPTDPDSHTSLNIRLCFSSD
ncbi:MAG: hypothetical protein ACJ0UT_03055 [Candidatus Latescibacterota bacterium]